MNQLTSNIQLGHSFKQFFDWHIRNKTGKTCSEAIAKQLLWKARRKPWEYGTRTAALIGNCYDQLEGEDREFALDASIKGIHLANAELKRTQS